ncbi:MAG TPA: hypothetical protein VKY89_09755 [Thermoanaerobaculia bacterium]|jgi:hypothetical protein|nr:hypothetical protein [Thermoanaerobaculia bacterium]
MHKKLSKLTLRRETLQQLTTWQLQDAAGGITLPPICPPKTNTCNVHDYTCSGPRCL